MTAMRHTTAIGGVNYFRSKGPLVLRVVRRLPITEVYQNVSRSRAGVGQAPREETAGNIPLRQTNCRVVFLNK